VGPLCTRVVGGSCSTMCRLAVVCSHNCVVNTILCPWRRAA
jgi:hypothetical protein